MRGLWYFVTDFGDTGVTIPLAAAVFVILAVARQRRLALAWAASIAAAAGLIGALKIVLVICGRTPGSEIASPSGHTAMSVAVYGGLALLLGRSLARPARHAVPAGALGFVAVIALSRAVLHLHTPLEIGVGAAVGSATLALLAFLLARVPPQPIPAAWLAGAAIVLMAVLHGMRWPTERAVHGGAGLLRWLVACGG